MIPAGGFKPGEIPSGALPPGFVLPEGMKLPPDLQVDIDIQTGSFKTTSGQVINLPKNFMPILGADGKAVEIPKLDDGRMLPLPPAALGATKGVPAAGSVQISDLAKNQLKSTLGIDFSNTQGVSSQQFTSSLKNMPMSALENMGKDTLDALYNNMSADKLDIFDPAVQAKMDKVYEERNNTLGIGDLDTKIKELNRQAPDVLSLDRNKLSQMLVNLEAMKGNSNADQGKIEEAITKTKDALASQQRLDAIRQQVAQLTEIKQRLVKRSQDILTEISELGKMTFTPKEQFEIEEEIKASGSGTVLDQPAKIQALIEKYAAKITPTSVSPKDALKLSSLYEKANDMAKASSFSSHG